jgi:uncharacterized surface anchored protein
MYGALAVSPRSPGVRHSPKLRCAGATVRVQAASRLAVATVTTDQAGRFSIADLPDGAYQVVVTKGAFADATVAAPPDSR